MTHFQPGDTVQVRHSRVHPGVGRVIELLPVRIRVKFPTGGYGGGEYIDDFPPAVLEHVHDAIAPGQVWQRKPAGHLYRVTEVGGSAFAQDIVLNNLHNARLTRISPTGLRSKFTPRPDLEQSDTSASGHRA